MSDPTIERLAQNRLRGLTIGQLIEAFAETETDDADEIPTVRGWIMDELERRDKAAFNSWLDSRDMTIGDLADAFVGVA